jgi:hypothetical protein
MTNSIPIPPKQALLDSPKPKKGKCSGVNKKAKSSEESKKGAGTSKTKK